MAKCGHMGCGADTYCTAPKLTDYQVGTYPLTGDKDIDEMFRRCIETMATKGAEYTEGSVDRLANFRRTGEECDIPMEKAWYVFFNKHLSAIKSYLKNGNKVKSNEPIESRIMDCIVYLFLFYKMTIELEQNNRQKHDEEK